MPMIWPMIWPASAPFSARFWLRALVFVLALCAAAPPLARAVDYTTSYTWDANRRLAMTISADPGTGVRIATKNTYDADGLLTKVEKGTTTSATGTPFTVLETTTFAYDSAGNKIKQTAPGDTAAGIVTQFSYYDNDLPKCTALRMNTAVYGSLPSDACALSTTGGLGPDRITKLIYDAASQKLVEKRAFATALEQDYATSTYTDNGKPATVEDANHNRSTYEYDGVDRLAKLRFPVKTGGPHVSSTTDVEAYAYDPANNRTSLTKRDGGVIGYAYDALGREIFKDIPGGASTDVYSSYDLLGRKLYAHFASAGGSGVDYVYDKPGRLTSETSFGRALAFQYDVAGNRTRVTFPDALYEQYGFDALGRMTTIGENGATSGTGLLASYSYDNLGRRSGIARAGAAAAATSYSYDGASRLSALTQNPAGTANDLTLAFTFSPASQILTRAGSNSVYDWPKPANATTAYVPNGLNQYSSVGGTAYSYDNNANLLSDGPRSFFYDIENRLTRVFPTATPASSYLLIDYDPLGRIKQTTNAAGTVTQFLYDGDRLVAEYDGSGALLRRYAHGAGVDEPLVWYEGSGTTNRKWLLSDNQGSVIAESDSSGAVAQKYQYGPYGEPNTWTGSRFRYTGQIALNDDANVHLYHYKGRVYDPKDGRFLQTDPIGYKDDYNLYAYVANDPIDRMDPTGLATCEKGMPAEICQAAKDAEPTAIANLRTAAGALAKAAGGGSLTKKEQKIVSRADRVFATKGMSASARSQVLAEGSRNLTAIADTLASSETKYAFEEDAGLIDNSTPAMDGSPATIGLSASFLTDTKYGRAGILEHGAGHASGIAPSHRMITIPGWGTVYGGAFGDFFNDATIAYITSQVGRAEYKPFRETDAYRCVTPGATHCGF